MLRLSILFAFVLALATCVLSAPTPVVTAAPSIDVGSLEERDNNLLEARAAKKKTTAKKSKAKATQELYVSPSSYSGKATWFTQNGQPGSCGKWNNDNTPLVAMSQAMVGSMGNKCGSWVTIKNTSNGKTVKALVQDTCPGCSWGSLDLSLDAFKAIGNLDTGVLPISWSFN
ncbi:RlpA-like double-psi beta-barrel domain-containing protein [Sporobolomyces salmoneus]|uniref:RlpA-like double-psi beta-barrel domain-containing protein n=1 Tax=Sporobolomyces salmoneus TaxID=183962 RepID=UPI00317179A1